MALVVNLQRKTKIDTKAYRDFANELSTIVEEAEAGDFSVALISDKRMKELNRFFRDKDSTTDVLSFPHEADQFVQSVRFSPSVNEGQAEDITQNQDFLGDIVISAEQAERQAKENKLSLDREIKQLMLHGLLHLCGYDHENDNGEMNRRELDLRRKLKI